MPFYQLSASGGLVEASTFAALPATGATGTLYVVTGTNVLYRWSGSAYVEVSASPADVIEAANLAAFPATGAAGKIYLAIDTGKAYRWSGSAYVEVSGSDWATITNKPATFAPSAHTHAIADTTGLQSALDAKAGASDSRLTDAREWSAETVSQGEAESGSSTTRRAFTAQRVFQAIAAWWAASSAKTKLDGIASGATANATDAQLRDRATHTGTQAISTVSGLQTALDAAVSRADATGTIEVGPTFIAKRNGAPEFPAETTMLEVSDGIDITAQIKANGAASFFSINRSSMPLASTTQRGAIVVGAGLSVASGTVAAAYGTTAGTACQGNDSRLSDARAPLAHTHSASDITSGALALAGGSATSAAVQHTGSAGTGVFFPANGSVAITASGAESFRVDSAGRVLVGLTSSYAVANKLQTTSLAVAGADITQGGQIASFVSRGSCWMGNADGTRGFIVATTTGNVLAMTGLNYSVSAYNDLCLQAGNFFQLYLGTNGRVGIQTNAATARLQVQGAGAGTAQTFAATNSSTHELLWCLDNGNQFSSAGRFASASDARFARYHVRATTTNVATIANLFLNGTNQNITVSATSAYMFTIRLVAYSTTQNQAAGWFFRGVARRNAANETVLVGTVAKESWVESGLSGVDANVAVDDSTETLRVQVNGLVGATIRWHATVETSEVSFGAQ
jgi:hypothetical protein